MIVILVLADLRRQKYRIASTTSVQSRHTPCDFWLFPKLKKPLKGQRFDDKTTVENNATSVFKAIPKSEFQDCFEKWKHRWNRVIQLNGDYFEGCHPPDNEEYNASAEI